MIKIEKSCFFSFNHYVHYAMMKRKKAFFIQSLHSLRHDQQENLFSFQHYIRYAMITRKRNRFLLHRCLDYTTTIKKYPFLISLRRSLCKYLLTSHYFTNEKVSKRYLPQKNMCHLKTFFLRNFSGILHDLLPSFLVSLISITVIFLS